MKKSIWLAVVGLAAVLVVLVATRQVSALPAFARKYRTSCATCHESFPRLNAVGEAFRLNGYKFADDEIYIKEEPVELGDEAYKRLWPKSIWPSDIPGTAPFSVILRSDFEADIGGTKEARTQFVFPKTAKLIGAGALGDRMSMFTELVFARGGDHGGHGSSGEGTQTELAGWIQFEDILLGENCVNVRVGTVGMQEMGLFNARNHNRLTVNPYLYSSWSMPMPDHEETETALLPLVGAEGHLEGNPFDFMLHAQPGIEVNGFGKTWRYAAGIVNGNGDEFSDNNSEKDYYGQLAYKIGGLGFDGSGAQEDAGKLPSTGAESWRDDSVILSLFGYGGTGLVTAEGDTDEVVSEDDFWRLGLAVQCKCKDLVVRGGYIWGSNDNPFGALAPQSVDSESWFVEVEYFLYPWLIPNARYETLRLGLPGGIDAIDPDQDRQRVIVGVKALLRANVSLSVEGRLYTRDQRQRDRDDESQIVLSLNAAI